MSKDVKVCYRSNVQATYSVLSLKGVDESHLELCRGSPFYSFFVSLFLRKLTDDKRSLEKNNYFIAYLIGLYKKGGFEIKDKILELTRQDVQLILGIDGTGVEPVPTSEVILPRDTPWYRRNFGNSTVVTEPMLKQRIEELLSKEQTEEVLHDFVTVLHLLTLSSLLFSSRFEVQSFLLPLCEEFENIKKYDWPSAIIKELMNSIAKDAENPQYVHGCTYILGPWLYEHINSIGRHRTGFDKVYPRFLRWDLSYMRPTGLINSLQKVTPDKIHTGELEQTDLESKILTNGVDILEALKSEYPIKSSRNEQLNNDYQYDDYQYDDNQDFVNVAGPSDEENVKRREEEEKAKLEEKIREAEEDKRKLEEEIVKLKEKLMEEENEKKKVQEEKATLEEKFVQEEEEKKKMVEENIKLKQNLREEEEEKKKAIEELSKVHTELKMFREEEEKKKEEEEKKKEEEEKKRMEKEMKKQKAEEMKKTKAGKRDKAKGETSLKRLRTTLNPPEDVIDESFNKLMNKGRQSNLHIKTGYYLRKRNA